MASDGGAPQLARLRSGHRGAGGRARKASLGGASQASGRSSLVDGMSFARPRRDSAASAVGPYAARPARERRPSGASGGVPMVDPPADGPDPPPVPVPVSGPPEAPPGAAARSSRRFSVVTPRGGGARRLAGARSSQRMAALRLDELSEAADDGPRPFGERRVRRGRGRGSAPRRIHPTEVVARHTESIVRPYARAAAAYRAHMALFPGVVEARRSMCAAAGRTEAPRRLPQRPRARVAARMATAAAATGGPADERAREPHYTPPGALPASPRDTKLPRYMRKFASAPALRPLEPGRGRGARVRAAAPRRAASPAADVSQRAYMSTFASPPREPWELWLRCDPGDDPMERLAAAEALRSVGVEGGGAPARPRPLSPLSPAEGAPDMARSAVEADIQRSSGAAHQLRDPPELYEPVPFADGEPYDRGGEKCAHRSSPSPRATSSRATSPVSGERARRKLYGAFEYGKTGPPAPQAGGGSQQTWDRKRAVVLLS